MDPRIHETNVEVDPGRSGSSPGFDEETRSFLQQRLRMLTGTLAAVLGVLLALFFVANASGADQSLWRELVAVVVGFPNVIVTVLLGITGGLHLLLRRRRLPAGALAVVDGVLLQALIVPCLALFAILHEFSFSGFPAVVPFLCLFLLTRAVLVPSTARRTTLLSLPAPLGVLAIQLWHGASYAYPGEPYPGGHFLDMLVQNQVLLVASVAVGAVASRVNLGLRRRTYDARRLGQYDVEGKIGAGAMGEVYLARHALLKRPTAIKLLRPEITGDATLQRFEQEVQQTSRLSHPHTVSIFDYGHTAEGIFYYAMEFLVGADLRRIVATDGPMPPPRVIHVLEGACAALSEAHSKGIVHRDLKPSNVMLCEQGGEPDFVKILDFGLARVLDGSSGPGESPGSLIGTPETMAPEAIHTYAVSPRSDLYSLAVTGCFLLTGRPVFDATTVSEFLRAHQSAPPIPPSKRVDGVPRDLERILMRTLAKDPGQRFQTASEMRDALLGCEDAGTWSLAEARRWWKAFEKEHPVLRPEDLLAADPDARISADQLAERAAAASATARTRGEPATRVPSDVSDSAATSFGEPEVSDSAETSFGDRNAPDRAGTRSDERGTPDSAEPNLDERDPPMGRD